jgi:hypothetical protein
MVTFYTTKLIFVSSFLLFDPYQFLAFGTLDFFGC